MKQIFLLTLLLAVSYRAACREIQPETTAPVKKDSISRSAFWGADYLSGEKKDGYYTSGFTFGAGFLTGYGRFTGELGKRYSGFIPIFLDMSLTKYRVSLAFRALAGTCKTKVDIPGSNGVWPRGEYASIIKIGGDLGCDVYEYKRWKFTPTAGISSMSIGQSANEENKVPGVNMRSYAYNLGLNIDFKTGFMHNGYSLLRLKYTYSLPQFHRKYEGMSGSAHMITLTVGGCYGGYW